MRGTGAGEGFWHLLTDADRTALSGLGRNTTFRPGSTICGEGEPATHVFILVVGWVKVLSVTSEGHEELLALRGHGDIVGEIAGETDGYRVASMRAVNQVRSLIVGHIRFSSFLSSHPEADRAYHRVLARRWSESDAELRLRSSTSGGQRLAGVLLDLAALFGVPSSSGIEIAELLSQDELASLAGASRATVARALATWRDRDIIRSGQRFIAITDEQQLRQIASRVIR
jgi:CRP/FNR family transcriptional regulator, cyclic AMP receptor protein